MLLTIYQKVFTIDGVDLNDLKFNNVPYQYNMEVRTAAKKFSASRISLVAAFLGLPHRLLAPAQSQSFTNLIKNFFGWRDTVKPAKNILMVPYMTALNILITQLKFAFNIVKIFTEFLPMLASEKLLKLSREYHADAIAQTVAESVPLYILAGLSYIGGKAAALLLLAGQHVTSPNVALKTLWNQGKRIGGSAGLFFIGFFMTASFMSIIALYVVCMPLAMKFLAMKLPSAVTSVVNSFGDALEPFFKFMANIALSIAPVEVAPSAAVGFAGMIAMGSALFGTLARRVSSKFKAFYHKPDPGVVLVPVVAAAQVPAEEKVIPVAPNPQPAPPVSVMYPASSSPLASVSLFQPADEKHEQKMPLHHTRIPSLP